MRYTDPHVRYFTFRHRRGHHFVTSSCVVDLTIVDLCADVGDVGRWWAAAARLYLSRSDCTMYTTSVMRLPCMHWRRLIVVVNPLMDTQCHVE